MDHSVQAYITRQPTQTLWGLLRWFMATKERAYSNQDNIRLALQELEKRYKDVSGEVPAEVEQAWNEFLECMVEITEDNCQ